MRFLILYLFTSLIYGQNIVIDLQGDTLKLPYNYEQYYHDVKIKNGTLLSDFPELKELDLDNYKNEDGLYVVSKGKFIPGGAFPSIKWNGIYVNWGSIVEYKKGKWSRWNVKTGFNFTGSLELENVTFVDIPFFLFNFTGQGHSRTIRVKNCKASNIRRFLASSRTFRKWIKQSLNDKTTQDGVHFTFDLVSIENSSFNLVHEGIIWGAPTIKKFVFNYNEVLNSPNINSIANLLPIVNYNPSSIHYYIKNSSAEIKYNLVKNCVNHSYDRTSIYRHFFRILSNSNFSFNEFDNVNGMMVFTSGGGNLISYNTVRGFYRPTKIAQTGWIVHKHAVTGGAVNLAYKNKVTRGNQPFFVMTFSNDYDFIGNEYTDTSYISEVKDENTIWFNNGKVYYYDTILKKWKLNNYFHANRAVYHFDRQGYPQNMTLNSINNKYRSHLLYRMLGQDGKYSEGQNLFVNFVGDSLTINRKTYSRSTAKKITETNLIEQ